MIGTEKHSERGKQILRALHEHGALSTWGLQRILPGPITKDNIRSSLGTLKLTNLIVQRFDSLPHNSGNFYQLSLTEETRPLIANKLKMDPIHLQKHIVRDQELFHSQLCAVWCTWFRRYYPNAVVLREFQYVQEELYKNILVLSRDSYELKPDIIMRLPKENGKGFANIAIEIERSRKTDTRLLQKLKKLSSQTRLDGVIYICSTTSLLETIRGLYEGKIRERALRINHYGNNFFLFSNGADAWQDQMPICFNSELKNVLLEDWVQFLVSTETGQRREANLRVTPNAQGHDS